jgi:ferredoxin
MTLNPYAQRKTLRAVEKLWSRFEGFINRLTQSDFNPFYHLGTLTIFMLLVLIFTGVYLTAIYRPGLDVAYATVQKIDSNWFGSLMRSVHRYASDAMILLVILHILKIFFSDRYWGQRWLAWTSGWIMLVGVWLTGTMGYWLVWDLRAQWLTEYMMQTLAGTSGLTYVATDIESRTFSNFVIIIFLHIFLPLIGFLGVYIHGIRLSRARWWSPRWVSIQAAVGLIILALIKPVQLFAEANLSTMISSVPMDAYYLGFLPVIESSGNALFWGLALLIGGSLFALPWIAAGRDLGPALVDDPKCTGCNICYAECPFDAINMTERQAESKYNKLAVINATQCTGCGICVGACPTDAITLKGGYDGERVFSAVKGALSREQKAGNAVTILFASHRDEALGCLPARLATGGADSPIAVSTWGEARVVTAILPVASAVNIEWIKTLRRAGARDIVILSQPYDDGIYREDAHWLLNRLHLRPALVTKDLHWLETTLGDSKTVEVFLDDLHQAETQAKKSAPILPVVKDRDKLTPSLISGLVGTVLLLGMFALALPLDIPAGTKAAEQSALRVAVDAKGKIDVSAIPEGFDLPPGADAEKIFGGSHFPISVRVMLDGKIILEDTYQASGISGNGRISALKFLEIPSGAHQVEVLMKDNPDDFRSVFSQTVTFEKGKALILAYDEKTGLFVLR